MENLSLFSHMALSHRQPDMLTVNDITDCLRHAVARGLLGRRRWRWCKTGMKFGHLLPLSGLYWSTGAGFARYKITLFVHRVAHRDDLSAYTQFQVTYTCFCEGQTLQKPFRNVIIQWKCPPYFLFECFFFYSLEHTVNKSHHVWPEQKYSVTHYYHKPFISEQGLIICQTCCSGHQGRQLNIDSVWSNASSRIP